MEDPDPHGIKVSAVSNADDHSNGQGPDAKELKSGKRKSKDKDKDKDKVKSKKGNT